MSTTKETEPSASKIIASDFWVANGILLVDYLEKERSINSDYYCGLHEQLLPSMRNYFDPNAKKNHIHQDNVPAHQDSKTNVKINSLGFNWSLHAPYSPDLAPLSSSFIKI